jgi:hypothetical protein
MQGVLRGGSIKVNGGMVLLEFTMCSLAGGGGRLKRFNEYIQF